MGLWDRISGEAARREHPQLREDFTVKGLSDETMAAVEAGELEIVDDDPQADLLKEKGGQDA